MRFLSFAGAASLPCVMFAVLLVACGGEDAVRRALPVQVDGSHLAPVTNDLGWTVTLDEARLVASAIELTVAGETHAKSEPSMWDSVRHFVLGQAHAHPGHLADGDVAGELVGPFVVDWFAPSFLGAATAFEGDYEGANLRLVLARTEHGLDAADPLVGHGAFVAGHATRDGRTVRFEARLSMPEPAVIVGLPFALTVDHTTDVTLGLALYPQDPFEGDTLFDGLDFGQLADTIPTDVLVLPEAENNRFKRLFFSHDHHGITVLTPN